MLGLHLVAQHLVEEVGVGRGPFGGLFEQGRELGLHVMEPEALAVGGEALQLGRRHDGALGVEWVG